MAGIMPDSRETRVILRPYFPGAYPLEEVVCGRRREGDEAQGERLI